MKVVVIRAFGGPEGLAVAEAPDPSPGAGEVLIDIEAIGVGFQDVMIRSGVLAAAGFKPGHIPGGEIAGVVSQVGSGVERSWIGRRVWAFIGLGGGYAEKAVAPAAGLIEVPLALTSADAVTIGSSGMVAHFALRHGHFTPGEAVLVRGAAGPLGILLVQLAASGGAGAIVVTSSSPTRGDRLRELGATHVLDRKGMGDGPAAYDVIIDIVSGPEMSGFFSRLAPNGRMVAIGAVGGFPPQDFAWPMYPAFQKSLSFATFSASTVTEAQRMAVTADLLSAAARGDLKVVIDEILPLDQAERAHRRMEAGGVFGRLLLSPTAL